MDESDKDKEAPEAVIVTPAETTTKSGNGVPAKPAPPPLSPEVERFARYFNKPVALHLRRPIMMLDYAGEMEAAGERYGLLAPAMMRTPEGEEVAVGAVLLLPVVMLNPSPNGQDLVGWVQSPATGAVIEILLAPTDIEYVTFVARAPQQHRILNASGN